ncbi:GNAT family N-acetyltransferase [Desulfuromonas carbonis]|uniref:GNAT family N-acetyltransferase n=1 Tax=Desulfuromonas sp. DDH964 TaxID=1823759 RepID=UPI00078DAF17|nr:GNAT family N-acetyltransferase [Desulfuromonas sp. DDH964]AMV70478.1 GNAT family acetyltransferase [Desulfuromonas sp. DDH964]
MEFATPTVCEWPCFRAWAAAENWRVPLREEQLFQDQWWPHFFVLRLAGRPLGFVSAVAYQESGWIGNLLVAPESRGRGFGAALFDFAVERLNLARVKRIWLTASGAGLPLYQRRGFLPCDRVERWQGPGQGLGGGLPTPPELLEKLIALDWRCWGEDRSPLITALAMPAMILQQGESLALLQPDPNAWQLGPWLSPGRCPRENRLLLLQALERTPAERPLVIDLLRSSGMGPLLRSAGFVLSGNNELMSWGAMPPAREGVIALASLGSIG